MNHKFRKKPVVIEAFQMTKERRWNNADWPNWLHEANPKGFATGSITTIKLYCIVNVVFDKNRVASMERRRKTANPTGRYISSPHIQAFALELY